MRCCFHRSASHPDWRHRLEKRGGKSTGYWRDIHRSTLGHCKVPDCNFSGQYENIHDQYLPPNNFDAGAKLYDSPCNQMRTTLNYLQKDLSTADSVLVLAMSYNTEEYREVLNHRAMGKDSLYLYFIKENELCMQFCSFLRKGSIQKGKKPLLINEKVR